VDEVYYLQRYSEGWEDGKWTERVDERDCIDPTGFTQVSILCFSANCALMKKKMNWSVFVYVAFQFI